MGLPSAPLNIQIENTTYHFKTTLTGRGQTGVAGFYTKDNQPEKEYLIKQDKPETCLAESLVVNYLPEDTKVFPLIQAEVSQLGSLTLSIQPKFSTSTEETKSNVKVESFDVFILGKKRNPKTLVSEEFKSKNTISRVIYNMDEGVKKQLAAAIYISQLNGDESLHVGQFMIKKQDNKIIEIARVDLGALGRYAKARTDFDPLHTSQAYRTSGQLGKDYVSYLLQDNVVKRELINYWINTDVNKVIELVAARFDSQVNNLKGKARDDALSGFYQTLTKKSSHTIPNISDAMIKQLLIETTRTRCNEMRDAAIIRKTQIEIKEYLQKKTDVAQNTEVMNLIERVNGVANHTSPKPSSQRLTEIRNLISSDKFDVKLDTSIGFTQFLNFLKKILIPIIPTSHLPPQKVANPQKFLDFKTQLEKIVKPSNEEPTKGFDHS